MVAKNNQTVASMQSRFQESHAPTGRTNINDINRRNANQEKQEKKSSYVLAGLVVLFIAIIIFAIYFFS